MAVNTPAFSSPAGQIRATNDIIAYYSSDQRLKENIRQIPGALDLLNNINGVYFDWTEEHLKKNGGEDGYFVRKNDLGVIAQEVEKIFPEAVAKREDGYYAVRYDKLIPSLIEAVKELSQRVKNIEQGK